MYARFTKHFSLSHLSLSHLRLSHLSLYLWIALTACGFTACQTVIKFDGENPEVFLQRPDIINLPYKISEQGLILVDAAIDDGPPVAMIIDSGATRSALYENVYERLDVEASSNMVNIFGLTGSGTRPEVTLPFLELDGHKIETVPMAVLETSAQNASLTSSKIGGLIGLDVLKNYYIFFDQNRRVLSLIPAQYAAPNLPVSWAHVTLKSNPYKTDDLALKYIDLRMNGQIVPALFDTGSEFNLINWPAIKHPQIWANRRKLREQWELAGAIGTFKPQLNVKGLDLRSGPKSWTEQDFLILDFDNLDILGVENQPFIIAGSHMFTDTTFWLDFNQGKMAFKTSLEELKASVKSPASSRP